MGERKPKMCFDSFEVDLSSGALCKDGIRIRIQEQPLKVLIFLLENAQEVVTREQLKAHIWPEDSFGDFDHGVNAAIAKLRIALGDSAENPRYVETLPRRGYRFLVPVEGAGPLPRAVQPPPSASVELPSAHSGRGLYLGLATVAVCIAGIAGAVVLLRGKSSEPPAAYQNAKVTRITSDGNVGSVAMSPDGHYIAFSTNSKGKQSLRVRQLSSANSVEIASSDAAYQDLLYAPNGNAIFYRQVDQTGQTGLIYQIPALGGMPRHVSSDVDSDFTVSPDGKQLAFIRHNPPLKMSQLIVAMTDGSGEKVLITTKYPETLDSPSWSRDGAHLACTHREALLGNVFDLVEVDAATGKRSAPLLHNWHGIGQIAWTTHSDGLVFVALDESGFGHGQLFYLPYPKGAPSKITNGVEIYDGVSMSADSQHLATVLERFDSDIWIAVASDLEHPRKFTSGKGNTNGALGLAYGRDGNVVFSSRATGAETLWIGSPKAGTIQQLIPDADEDFGPLVMPDGSVVFTSPRVTGKLNLWHVDSDGTNPRQLTSGADDLSPVSTPDGHWIFYQSSTNGQSLIMKTPIADGKPESVSDLLSGPPAISPDGKLLAYIVALRDGAKLAVEPLDHSWPRRLLSSPPLSGWILTRANGNIAWGREGKSVQYISELGGASNIWSQSISGGPPKQLTHFPSGRIFAFAWSPDYKEMALAKGEITRDVVTIDEQK